ncbi:TPA: hypothetical protein WI034_001497 [Neisseria meningitidis]|nr:hypothetical protein [Neisseria meningitidis]
MATIMEKDVLIEVVSSNLALISRNIDDIRELENNEDRKKLLQIRKFLYCSFPHEINYDTILQECKSIKNRYIGVGK